MASYVSFIDATQAISPGTPPDKSVRTHQVTVTVSLTVHTVPVVGSVTGGVYTSRDATLRFRGIAIAKDASAATNKDVKIIISGVNVYGEGNREGRRRQATHDALHRLI